MINSLSKYDKIDSFIALIEILEIKGNNPLIKDLQESVYGVFKKEYNELGIDFVINLVLKAREKAK